MVMNSRDILSMGDKGIKALRAVKRAQAIVPAKPKKLTWKQKIRNFFLGIKIFFVSIKEVLGGIVGGAITGLIVGTAGGPASMIVGAVVGAIGGGAAAVVAKVVKRKGAAEHKKLKIELKQQSEVKIAEANSDRALALEQAAVAKAEVQQTRADSKTKDARIKLLEDRMEKKEEEDEKFKAEFSSRLAKLETGKGGKPGEPLVVIKPAESCHKIDVAKRVGSESIKSEKRSTEIPKTEEPKRDRLTAEIPKQTTGKASPVKSDKEKIYDDRIDQQLTFVRIPGDGHCLFSAVGYHFEPKRTLVEMRRDVAEELQENKDCDEYKGYFEYMEEQTSLPSEKLIEAIGHGEYVETEPNTDQGKSRLRKITAWFVRENEQQLSEVLINYRILEGKTSFKEFVEAIERGELRFDRSKLFIKNLEKQACKLLAWGDDVHRRAMMNREKRAIIVLRRDRGSESVPQTVKLSAPQQASEDVEKFKDKEIIFVLYNGVDHYDTYTVAGKDSVERNRIGREIFRKLYQNACDAESKRKDDAEDKKQAEAKQQPEKKEQPELKKEKDRKQDAKQQEPKQEPKVTIEETPAAAKKLAFNIPGLTLSDAGAGSFIQVLCQGLYGIHRFDILYGIRSALAKHIEKNKEHYKKYIPKDIDLYIAEIRERRLIDDLLSIRILSTLFNRPIIILKDNKCRDKNLALHLFFQVKQNPIFIVDCGEGRYQLANVSDAEKRGRQILIAIAKNTPDERPYETSLEWDIFMGMLKPSESIVAPCRPIDFSSAASVIRLFDKPMDHADGGQAVADKSPSPDKRI